MEVLEKYQLSTGDNPLERLDMATTQGTWADRPIPLIETPSKTIDPVPCSIIRHIYCSNH
jgi:hypothetical protein